MQVGDYMQARGLCRVQNLSRHVQGPAKGESIVMKYACVHFMFSEASYSP